MPGPDSPDSPVGPDGPGPALPGFHDIAGRLAVVTGGAHGIGLAIVRLLERAGATVVVIDRRGDLLAENCGGGRCIPMEADIAAEDAEALAERLVREHGPPELIVNNVGVTTPQGFLELDPAAFDLVLHTNLRGPWFFTRRLVSALVSAGRPGAIVFVSSVHQSFVRRYPHYSATKAAIAMLTRELAYDLAPHRIRVNAIAPGWIRTEDSIDPARAEAFSALIPLARPGRPEDVAKLALVLLSDEWAGYVTGANVPVDGGLSLHNWLMDLPPEPTGG
jgi:glucose 1-dehydrogenase